MRSRIYTSTTAAFGVEHGRAWMKAEYEDGQVFIDKFCCPPLSPVQMRKFAAWLIERAIEAECRASEKGGAK